MTDNNPTIVRIENEWHRFGIAIRMFRKPGDGTVVVRGFGEPTDTVIQLDEAATPIDVEPLRIDEDEARALYEALADHFGHSGNDTRALRRDYDAERGRVDQLINALRRGDADKARWVWPYLTLAELTVATRLLDTAAAVARDVLTKEDR